MLELKSGDLCVPSGDHFSDYRRAGVGRSNSGAKSRFTANRRASQWRARTFIDGLRAQLQAAAKLADDGFPDNEYLRIENGEPVLKRLQRKPEPDGLLQLEQQLMPNAWRDVEIVDALSDTEHWLNWTR